MGVAGSTVLFATLGFSDEPIRLALRARRWDEVHVFFGGGPAGDKSRSGFEKVRQACDLLGVACAGHKVVDPYEYTLFLSAFGDARAALPSDARVAVCGSGGTPVMVMAATIFATVNRMTLLHFDSYSERSKAGREIPVAAFEGVGGLRKTKRGILERLRHRGAADMATLAREFGVTPSTLTVHVRDLVSAGRVRVSRLGKRRLVQLPEDVENMSGALARGAPISRVRRSAA